MSEKGLLQIVDQYQRIIQKVCRIDRNNKEDQEDLFQDIVFQLWKSYPTFRGESKVSTWMYRIAINTAIALYRKKTVRTETFEDIQEKDQPTTRWNGS